ncbi:hypothetical protein JL720_10455 [Aureococcus anophagefferens]|nr:hypothetical protein JL720_10455 [Aureococcus anophagefferens]
MPSSKPTVAPSTAAPSAAPSKKPSAPTTRSPTTRSPTTDAPTTFSPTTFPRRPFPSTLAPSTSSPSPAPSAASRASGRLTFGGMTVDEAEAHDFVFVAAVADVAGVDGGAVSVAFSGARRRLDEGGGVAVTRHRRGVERRGVGPGSDLADVDAGAVDAAVAKAAEDAGVADADAPTTAAPSAAPTAAACADLAAAGAVAAPPRLASAAFSDTGAELLATFDVATDRAGFAAGVPFGCGAVLAFAGADAASCYWVDASRVSADVGPATAFSPGDNATLVAGVLRVRCAGRCDCDAPANASSVVAAPPAAPAAPVAVLEGPTTVGACDGLAVDAYLSTGGGGRDLTYAWSAAPGDASAVAGLVAAANLDGGRPEFLAAPADLEALHAAGVDALEVTVVVANFLGGVSAPAAPSSVRAGAIATSCDGREAADRAVAITWRLFDDAGGLVDLASTSNDQRYFKLPAYSLEAAKTYALEATAVDVVGGANATQTVALSVGTSPVVAVLAGGDRVVPAAAALDVDASGSYDGDVEATAPSKLTFAWACDDAACDAALGDSQAPKRTVDLAPGTYAIAVTATAPTARGRRATYVVAAEPAPVVAVDGPAGRVAATSRVVLYGSASHDGGGNVTTAGVVAAAPPRGVALETRFELRTSSWASEDPPLTYAFRARSGASSSTLHASSLATSLGDVVLPEGNNTIVAVATDALGAAAEAAATVAASAAPRATRRALAAERLDEARALGDSEGVCMTVVAAAPGADAGLVASLVDAVAASPRRRAVRPRETVAGAAPRGGGPLLLTFYGAAPANATGGNATCAPGATAPWACGGNLTLTAPCLPGAVVAFFCPFDEAACVAWNGTAWDAACDAAVDGAAVTCDCPAAPAPADYAVTARSVLGTYAYAFAAAPGAAIAATPLLYWTLAALARLDDDAWRRAYERSRERGATLGEIVEASMPSFVGRLRGGALRWALELVRSHHSWCRILTHFARDAPRHRRCVTLLFTVLMIMFGQAVAYWFAYPVGFCERAEHRDDCLAKRTFFAEMVGALAGDGDPDRDACVWSDAPRRGEDRCALRAPEPHDVGFKRLFLIFLGVVLAIPFTELFDSTFVRYVCAPVAWTRAAREAPEKRRASRTASVHGGELKGNLVVTPGKTAAKHHHAVFGEFETADASLVAHDVGRRLWRNLHIDGPSLAVAEVPPATYYALRAVVPVMAAVRFQHRELLDALGDGGAAAGAVARLLDDLERRWAAAPLRKPRAERPRGWERAFAERTLRRLVHGQRVAAHYAEIARRVDDRRKAAALVVNLMRLARLSDTEAKILEQQLAADGAFDAPGPAPARLPAVSPRAKVAASVACLAAFAGPVYFLLVFAAAEGRKMTRAWYFSTLFFIFIAVGIVEPFTVFILKFCLPASAYAKLRWMRDPTLLDDPARVRLFVEPAALLPDDVASCFGALGADAPARLARDARAAGREPGGGAGEEVLAAAVGAPVARGAVERALLDEAAAGFARRRGADADRDGERRAHEAFAALGGAWEVAALERQAKRAKFAAPLYHGAAMAAAAAVLAVHPALRSCVIKQGMILVSLGICGSRVAFLRAFLDRADRAAPGLGPVALAWAAMVAACLAAVAVFKVRWWLTSLRRSAVAAERALEHAASEVAEVATCRARSRDVAARAARLDHSAAAARRVAAFVDAHHFGWAGVAGTALSSALLYADVADGGPDVEVAAGAARRGSKAYATLLTSAKGQAAKAVNELRGSVFS